MTKIPFAVPLGYTRALCSDEKKHACWFIFSADQLLIHGDHNCVPHAAPCALKRSLYMGTLEDTDLFAAEIETPSISSEWKWCSLRVLYGVLSEEHYALAGYAMQLLDWDRMHAYCGCCGTQTFVRPTERCRECPTCGQLAYPKVAPVAMALVKKGQQILLARSAHFPENMYSVIAGFVDPGETVEQCVMREVFEEVGLKVSNLQYFGSQPWPFSRSLIIAFTCDWQEGEIVADPLEIAHAAWFDTTNLPQLPQPFSLSRILIDAHCKQY